MKTKANGEGGGAFLEYKLLCQLPSRRDNKLAGRVYIQFIKKN